MRFRGYFGLALAGCSLWLGTAHAQAALPDPAAVQVPDVSPSSDPKVRENGFRYHYLHKAGVSYAQAHADFAVCERMAWNGLFASAAVPGFVPWPATADTQAQPQTADIDWARVAGAMNWTKDANARDRRINALWRCMKPRGYLRYAIPEASWGRIYDPKQGGSLAVEAKLASGPAPAGGAVAE